MAVRPVRTCSLLGPAWASDLPLHLEEKSRLTILSLSEVEANPVTILARIQELLTSLREAFDVIVVDTPPVLAVPDALMVVPHADQTLFVVQWAATLRRSLLYALDWFGLEERGRISLVFSKVDARSYQRYEAPGAERYGKLGRQSYGPLPRSSVTSRDANRPDSQAGSGAEAGTFRS